MVARRRRPWQRRDSWLLHEPKGVSGHSTPIIHQQSSFLNPKAFTLIELLVVIAIIAILMAILMPALSRVRRQARAVICQTKLRQWGMALNMYVQDNEGRFPMAGNAGAWLLRGTLLSVSSIDPNAPQDSLHHFRTKDLACCPMATRSKPPDTIKFTVPDSAPVGFEHGPIVSTGIPGSEFPAWVMVRPGPTFVGSYGMNGGVFRTGGFGPPVVVRGRFSTVDIFSIKGKGNIPLLLDSVTPSGDFVGSPPLSEQGAGNFFCINRHDGYVNGVFLDWSVRRIGLKGLWTLKWFKDFDTNGRWTKAGGVTPEQWPKWMRRFKDY
jgi:prepilin-type N-terminal cleavage/methylation domain-containing protein/prepilin-type processing-associated H-X9-DG protein